MPDDALHEDRLERACYVLALLCVPASMLLAAEFLPRPLRPLYGTYGKYFAVQSIAVLLAVLGVWQWLGAGRRPGSVPPLGVAFVCVVGSQRRVVRMALRDAPSRHPSGSAAHPLHRLCSAGQDAGPVDYLRGRFPGLRHRLGVDSGTLPARSVLRGRGAKSPLAAVP